jgi:hypothetical protein
MASDSDKVVYQEAVTPQETEPLFQAKRWTYVVDSSNTGGVFNGQLQFDLNTLSSQNQWTDLSQGYIQFPVKLSIKRSANAGTPGNLATCGLTAACIKNGFHQFVDSVQVVLGGSTVQSSQIFENINATYKMLSEWSSDELLKYGPSLGIALDNYQVLKDAGFSDTSSLDNATAATVGSASTGFFIPTDKNEGYKQRANMLNSSSAVTGLAKSILTSNQIVVGKSNVQATVTAPGLNNDHFVLFALGTIRLKDISDALSKIPPCKSLKGFIYVNYNAARTTITSGSATKHTPLYGRCMPAMLSSSGFGISGTAGDAVDFTAEVGATLSPNLTAASSISSTARLVVPYYVASPSIDRALTQKKTVRYNERFVTQFNIAAGGQVNQTLSPGITNPKRVILYPYFTGGNSEQTFLSNPLLSPFDPVPATTSPFAALTNLQIYCGNQPMYQQPISFDYDTWINESSQQGVDGGLVSQTSSGLLSQLTWNQLYRYYTVDIGRRLGADDGASKSVQISCNNATTCPMTVVAMIWYEREVVIDTAMGVVTQQL